MLLTHQQHSLGGRCDSIKGSGGKLRRDYDLQPATQPWRSL